MPAQIDKPLDLDSLERFIAHFGRDGQPEGPMWSTTSVRLDTLLHLIALVRAADDIVDNYGPDGGGALSRSLAASCAEYAKLRQRGAKEPK